MIDGFRSSNSLETNSRNLLNGECGGIKPMPRNDGKHIVDDIIEPVAILGSNELGEVFIVHQCIVTRAINNPWGNPEKRPGYSSYVPGATRAA